jgi:hypothetical protein
MVGFIVDKSFTFRPDLDLILCPLNYYINNEVFKTNVLTTANDDMKQIYLDGNNSWIPLIAVRKSYKVDAYELNDSKRLFYISMD